MVAATPTKRHADYNGSRSTGFLVQKCCSPQIMYTAPLSTYNFLKTSIVLERKSATYEVHLKQTLYSETSSNPFIYRLVFPPQHHLPVDCLRSSSEIASTHQEFGVPLGQHP